MPAPPGPPLSAVAAASADLTVAANANRMVAANADLTAVAKVEVQIAEVAKAEAILQKEDHNFSVFCKSFRACHCRTGQSSFANNSC
jgi:hypothetical protein